MANDPEPYVALPGLYGAPAYARPPKPASNSTRPFDPDDLPIEAYRSEEEREALAGWDAPGVGSYATSSATSTGGPRSEHDDASTATRRFTLRVLTERVRRPSR